MVTTATAELQLQKRGGIKPYRERKLSVNKKKGQKSKKHASLGS